MFPWNSTIAFATNAADSDGTVTKVEFYSNGSILWTVFTPPFSFNWPIGSEPGNYVLTVKAYDDRGAVTTSAPVTITLFIPLLLEGTLESTACTAISGWAWDARQPSTPINVDVYIDNVFLATVPANQFRQDLLNAGKGNGAHGYSVPTPNRLKDGVAHPVLVRFSSNGGDLANLPQSFRCFNVPPG